MQNLTLGAEMHPPVETSPFIASMKEFYLEYLKGIDHDRFVARDKPTLNCSTICENSVGRGIAMTITNSQRKAHIDVICENASVDPLYRLSPTNFMQMYNRELEYLNSLDGSDPWDNICTTILHEADQRLISYDADNPDFTALEDEVCKYNCYLADLYRDFEPWTDIMDDLRFIWETRCEEPSYKLLYREG